MEKEKEKEKTGGAKGCCGRGCEDCRAKNDTTSGEGCPKDGDCSSGCGGCCKPSGGCDLRGKLHSYDYWEDIPGGFADDDMVEVNFKNTRKGYFLNSGKIPLEVGDMVAVEAQPGHDIGRVTLTGALVRLQMRKAGVKPDAETRRVFRKAKASDLERYEQARARENDTMIRARKIAADLKLNMKIGDVEYQGDGNKAIFYYIADERVDFRQLIKVLAENFKVRIEMKQIGARQEAGRIGGIGPCGRPLCCSSWMTNFVSVATGAARYQDISLNPQKLAGQCAKLKCCLNFEIDTYLEASKKLPAKETRLETADSTYFYFKADIFKREITYSTDKNIPANLVTISGRRAFEVIGLNRRGIKPDSLTEENHRSEPKKPVDLLEQESLTRFDRNRKGKGGGDGNGGENSNNNRNRKKKKSGNGRPQQSAPQANSQREQSWQDRQPRQKQDRQAPKQGDQQQGERQQRNNNNRRPPRNNKPKPQGERPAQNDKPTQE